MKLREYELWVEAHAQYPLNDINYSFVGLAGEVGECMEWHKKVNLRAEITKLNKKDLRSELGDVLHYTTRIARKYGWTIKDLINDNVEKIEKRVKERNTPVQTR